MRGSRSLLWALLALAVISGCRSVPQFSSADSGRNFAALPSEYKLAVGQLLFVSDFELSTDHRLIRDLTAERDDICQTLDLPCTNERITVYLFRDAETYGQYRSRYFPGVPSRRAFFVETDTQLTVYAHWSDRVAEDLRHEVAHGYLHAVVDGLPLWLDEGLAEYFEVPRGQGGLNRPHVDLIADMIEQNGWQPDLARLEQIKDTAQMDQRSYAESWAWVYFLLQSGPERRELLTSYLLDVSARGATEPLSARLKRGHAEPERTLAEYLANLTQ